MDLTTQTPVEIDTELSRLWTERNAASQTILQLRERQKTVVLGRERHLGRGRYERKGGLKGLRGQERVEWRRRNNLDSYSLEYGNAGGLRNLGIKIREAHENMARIQGEIAPFEAEFTRRGGWNRYFLVQNTGGHVHREMNCSSCYPTTVYAWIVELADCDEREMVAQYGETACTVCFPDAPTMPEFAAAEKAKADAKKLDRCPGSGQQSSTPIDRGLCYPMGTCPECGERVGISRKSYSDMIPKHKSQAMKDADADVKRIAKNEAAGRCVESGREHTPEKELRQGAPLRVTCECSKVVKLTSTGKIPSHKAPKA